MEKYAFGIDIGGTTVKMGLFTAEGEKAETGPVEKIWVLEELRSGMSYTVGREFKVNESMIRIKLGIFKQKHT